MARALVFAHYDRDGLFDDYVVDALRKYRGITDKLIVVSTSASALPSPLLSLVDGFIPRDNVGYDFCSWRAGIESLGAVGGLDELICVNDSVYGPLDDLGPVLVDARLTGGDFWGMCLSQQGLRRRGKATCPHIQSWFFAMRRAILVSRSFARFWNSVEPLPTKEDVIDRYEIGMSEHFRRSGFRMAAIFDARVQQPPSRRDVWTHLSGREPMRSWRCLRKTLVPWATNPSEHFPLQLIDNGVPFVKVGVFRTNHYALNVSHVLDMLRAASPYDVRLIVNHLARVGRTLAGERVESGRWLADALRAAA